MSSPVIEEMSDMIQTTFDFLFMEYNFDFDHKESDIAGMRALFALTGNFRIQFFYDRGLVEVWIGGKGSPTGYADKVNGKRAWFSIWAILTYVAGKPKPTMDEIDALGTRLEEMTREEYLGSMAHSLRSSMPEIEALFADPEHDARMKCLEEYWFE